MKQKVVDANLSNALAYFSKSLFAMSDICSMKHINLAQETAATHPYLHFDELIGVSLVDILEVL